MCIIGAIDLIYKVSRGLIMKHINKNNDGIFINISNHARERFQQRYFLLYNKKFKTIEEIDSCIYNMFMLSKKESNKKLIKRRNDNKATDTLYYRFNEFRFVIQNQTLVTIEIANKKINKLNKINNIIEYSIIIKLQYNDDNNIKFKNLGRIYLNVPFKKEILLNKKYKDIIKKMFNDIEIDKKHWEAIIATINEKKTNKQNIIYNVNLFC